VSGLVDEELTPEQIIEEIKKLNVSDVLLSTVTTAAQLGYAKLDEGTQDLEQARLAIEALSALIPLLDAHVPQELSRDLHSMLANLQLAYASAAAAPGVD
jgi:hypothetical protein